MQGNDPTAEAVERFLRAHPGFLAERPALYGHMEPPRRVHGERLADHMEARLRAAQAAVPDRREAAGMAARVQDAVLALMRAHDKRECIEHEFPDLLGIDAARLAPTPVPLAVLAVLAGAEAVVRPATAATRPLHAEAGPLALTEALIRVSLPGGPALLVLTCRNAHGLGVRANGELAFLGRAVAAALTP